MHSLISALRNSVPPISKPIDFTSQNWLENALTDVLGQMTSLDKPGLIAAEEEVALYRRIMDSVVMVVVNYWAVERTASIGGRHTATFINPRTFEQSRAKKWQGSEDVTETNYLVMPRVLHADDQRKQKRIEAAWFQRWVSYHQEQPESVKFTLNNALLNSRRPNPVFLSWFAKGAEPDRLLTPASFNAERGRMKSWQVSPLPDAEGDAGLERFLTAFRAMFGASDGRYGEPGAITAMIGWLVRNFADLGGRCFFSIPAQVRINSGKGGNADNRDLRAVVSVSLRDRWDPKLYEAAWLFFNGVAHQVVHDIMTSEYVSWAHGQWDRNKSNAVYLASHPLSRRLNVIKTLSNELRIELAASHDPARADAIALKAKRLHKRAEIAHGFVNYINLLSDMLDPSAAEDVAASRRQNRDQPRQVGDHWIDLTDQIRRAAGQARDKSTGARTIRLVPALSDTLLVPRRLSTGKLKRHAGAEEELIELIFSELFENVANSGMIMIGEQRGAVPVYLAIHSQGSARVIEIENLIEPRLVEKAAEVARRIEAREDRRLASGLTLADELMSQLQLGEVQFSVRKALPNRWAGLKEEHHVWRTRIRVIT